VADPVTRGAARTAALIAVPVALLAGLLAFWRLGGFHSNAAAPTATPTGTATGVVEMAVPRLSPSQATMCLAFIAQLPDKLRDLPQRPVTAGGNQQNAAYGDPPVTAACGAPAASYPPDAGLYLVGGVCWYADDRDPAATDWTTVDRQVPIRVRLPRVYDGQWVREFTDAIVAAVPSLPEDKLPSGCTTPAPSQS
jgi:hypothetical protein